MDYRDKEHHEEKKSVPELRKSARVPVDALVELASRAKALDEAWVQRSLLALSVMDCPGLTNALLIQLRVRALIETLDPYPFDIPSEEDFV